MFIKNNISFERLFWLAIGVLSASIVLFAVLIGSQGQRIRSVSIDADAAVMNRNQKIEIALSMPVKSIEKKQVIISPEADFTVIAKGDTLIIQLKERLASKTKYEVKLLNLRLANNQEIDHELKHSFSTGSMPFYFLKRNYDITAESEFYEDKIRDEIFIGDIHTQDNKAIFEASYIQEYCVSKDYLIVATIEENDTNQLYSVNLSSLKKEELSAFDRGDVASLRCSPLNNTYGFIFSGVANANKKYQSVLFAGKAGEKNSASIPILGPNKEPLQVGDWSFAPDGTSILAHGNASVALLIDTLKQHDTIPLGKFYDIGDFNFNGKSFTATTPEGLSLVNIPDHSQKIISPQINETQPASVYPLQNSDGFVERTHTLESDTLSLRKQDKVTLLYEAQEPGSILSYMTSPNDQFLIVTVAKGHEMEYGAYNRRPMSKDIKTEIIDMKTFKNITTVDGFDITWPRS